jgi:pyroglutamyl-peptidase
MLRRRSRTPKTPKHAPDAPAPHAPRGRRRARPDAPVPAELILKPETRAAAQRAPALPAPPPKPVLAPKPGAPKAGEVVLVTGFEPFGAERTNPSWEVCTLLGPEIAGMRVEICRVPCEFRRAIEVVAEAIERLHPVLVVCLGQAGGRLRLGVERVAINIDDARIPDNSGVQPIDELIAPNGPPAYFASEVSNTAGTYVCNHLMYGVLHYLAASGHRARAGFIHVPYSEEQVLDKPNTPGMALATMVKGIRAAVAAAREHRHDVKASEGALG